MAVFAADVDGAGLELEGFQVLPVQSLGHREVLQPHTSACWLVGLLRLFIAIFNND